MDLPWEDVADHQDPLIFHQLTTSELDDADAGIKRWSNIVILPDSSDSDFLKRSHVHDDHDEIV